MLIPPHSLPGLKAGKGIRVRVSDCGAGIRGGVSKRLGPGIRGGVSGGHRRESQVLRGVKVRALRED